MALMVMMMRLRRVFGGVRESDTGWRSVGRRGRHTEGTLVQRIGNRTAAYHDKKREKKVQHTINKPTEKIESLLRMASNSPPPGSTQQRLDIDRPMISDIYAEY
jgi:hypothetical protein